MARRRRHRLAQASGRSSARDRGSRTGRRLLLLLAEILALLSIILPRARSPVSAAKNDFVVVAIGDSYISGEGNPEVNAQPVKADPNPPSATLQRFTPAQWLGRYPECHLSSKAWPFLAANGLQGAIGGRHVVFHSEACSGATIAGGPAGHNVLNQVDQLAKWLQQDHPKNDLDGKAGDKIDHIDALLISAGGDDIYFAKVIAHLPRSAVRRVGGVA